MIAGPITILKENATVESVLGRDSTTKVKVYPVRVPQKEGSDPVYPDQYLVVYKTPGQPVHGKGCRGEMELANFNVHCCASNYSKIDRLMEVVVDALQTSETVESEGYRYQGIWCTGDYDSFDEPARRFVRVVSFSTHSTKL